MAKVKYYAKENSSIGTQDKDSTTSVRPKTREGHPMRVLT